jgi:hypothetical protein
MPDDASTVREIVVMVLAIAAILSFIVLAVACETCVFGHLPVRTYDESFVTCDRCGKRLDLFS